ncbi:hypothetical protein Cgig2_016461 [Carnegiea gigantea]|uniref:Uncharacterized protein n=1 Tax=Carnegiea gigantea TaxID=171969 RepID=A0A9Q1JM26_9CARY|nr:hypothetical protein Cgig2_016461 [Carnegiea gigantea]
MIDTIMQQVSEQVKKAVEVTSYVRPLPLRESERLPTLTETGGRRERTEIAPLGPTPHTATAQAMGGPPSQLRPQHCDEHVRSPPRERHDLREGHLMMKRLPSMTSVPNPHNVLKHCEFYELNAHATAKCWELRKALHELEDKGQIDRFLKRGPHFPQEEREPGRLEPRGR